MTVNRIATFLVSGVLASVSALTALITLVLAILGTVAWLWPILAAVASLVFVGVVIATMIKMMANMDESFEPNGILGKFLNNVRVKF